MRGLLKRFWAVSLSLATRTGGRRSDRLPFLSVCVALALIGFVAAPRAFAQFQPPVGPIGTNVTLSSTSPQSHSGAAGLFTLTRANLNSGNTIQYTVARPAPLAAVTFERTRPLGSNAGFDVTAAFVGDHGLLFRVFDATSIDATSTQRLNTAVFLNLLQAFPIEVNLYSRKDIVTRQRTDTSPIAFPVVQFLRNVDGSSLFTLVFLQDTASPDTFELSVFRTDTGAFLCGMDPQDRQTGDTFTAEILDTDLLGGSDSVRIRHHTQNSGDFDQPCGLPVVGVTQTTRESVTSGGIQATGGGSGPGLGSVFPAISGDGRFVAFMSTATNLVTNDSNLASDIFVSDRTAGSTTRVSVTSAGTQATGGPSEFPAISGDGRFVAFGSFATNLVPNDTNGQSDIFVRDRATGSTTRVSVTSAGTQATGGHSVFPAISRDGRFVAFDSDAINLVPGDTNGQFDIFVRDRTAGSTTRVSVDSGGTQANKDSSFPAISGDGRFVVFASNATNLLDNDTNGQSDIFVRDRTAGTTTRVSVASNGSQATGASFGPDISGDGRFVAFESAAADLDANDTNGKTDIFVRSGRPDIVALLVRNDTTRVSVTASGTQANGRSFDAAISGDGRFVAFESDATNLVGANNDTNGLNDVFVRDRGEVVVGTFDLAPTDLTVAVHERFSYAFTWTVPAPLDWHELQFLQLRIRDGADTVLAVLWDEAGDTFRLLNAATGDYGPAFASGTQQRLQMPQATLYLAETSVVGSGPTGPSVTLNLSLSLKPQAAGRTFFVEVAASNDQGSADGFTQAGTLTVTP